MFRFPATREYSPGESFPAVAQLNGLGPASLVRREVLEQVGYYDEGIVRSADKDLHLRLAARYPLYYSANCHHAAWRRHADNLARRWKITDQADEGLRILKKAFHDPALPGNLQVGERSAYLYYYGKLLARARELVERGDLETVQKIVDILHQNGYAA